VLLNSQMYFLMSFFGLLYVVNYYNDIQLFKWDLFVQDQDFNQCPRQARNLAAICIVHKYRYGTGISTSVDHGPYPRRSSAGGGVGV
jgi:hypothetical protein